MPSPAVMSQRNVQIVAAVDSGAPPIEVAATYNLSASRVRAIVADAKRYATNGSGKNGSMPAARDDEDDDRDTPAARVGLEIGASGLKYDWGYIREEFLTDLNAPEKRYRIYNEMRSNDPVISSSLQATELSVRRIDWRIDGDDSDPRTEFIQGAWADMSHSWADHLSEALTFLPFGWSWFETVYKRRQGARLDGSSSNYRDGRIGWAKLAFRSQDSLYRWVFDPRGNVQAMQQSTYPHFAITTIPLEKSILYRTTREKNNPEGRSLLRAAYPSYYYAKNLRAIEAIGAERDLAGLPWVKLPDSASTREGGDDLNQAKKIVRNIRQDEQAGLVIPSGWEVGLMSSPGSKQFAVGDIITRHETRMAMAFLAQWIMLGMNGVGSYSLSSNLTDFFAMSVTTWADTIAETFSQYAIPRLLYLNGMPLENAPKLAHGPLGTPDLESISNFLSRLKDYIGPDADVENWLRGLIEAPRLTEIQIRRRDQEIAQTEAARTAALKNLSKTNPADDAGNAAEPDEAPAKAA